MRPAHYYHPDRPEVSASRRCRPRDVGFLLLKRLDSLLAGRGLDHDVAMPLEEGAEGREDAGVVVHEERVATLAA